MRTLRTGTAALLVFSLAASASAGDLQQSIAKAVEQQARQEEKAPPKSSSKPLVYGGAALFVTGMTIGLFAFINNENGSFAEFGEANAVNKPLGAAGLGMAFAGGTMMFLGSHHRGTAANRAPSISVGAGQVKVSKHVSW